MKKGIPLLGMEFMRDLNSGGSRYLLNVGS